MAARNGISTPIYKIDMDVTTAFFGQEIPAIDLPQQIVVQHNAEKGEEAFAAAGESVVDGCPILVYRNQLVRPIPTPWIKFYEKGIDLSGLSNQLQQLIGFVVVGSDLFVHTAGQAAPVFERFVDIAFPIDVGRRVAKPEIKGARSNQITGGTLASTVHFRDPRRLTRTESLENVWTALSGQLRDAVLREPDIVRIFGAKKKLRFEVTSAIKAGPKIHTPEQLVDFIRWLSRKAQAPLPDDDAWGILDSIKLLSVRKRKGLIDQLREHLATQVFVERDLDNLAIMHAEPALYDNATSYVVRQGSHDLYDNDSRPDLGDFVDAVVVDPARVSDCLRHITVTSENADLGPTARTNGTLFDHLHGELRHDEKTYFLLAGKWYEVESSYIEAVTSDFLRLMNDLDLDASQIGLRNWKAYETEGTYNESSMTAATFINGDRVLTDNIELFDGLATVAGDLYVVHVKDGFDVKVRDVRSQLVNSAQLIENDVRTGNYTVLKRHHTALVRNKRTQLSQSEFIKLFERPRAYVLAYGTRIKVHESTLARFASSVARIETVMLGSQFRQISTSDSVARLRIAWVKVVD